MPVLSLIGFSILTEIGLAALGPSFAGLCLRLPSAAPSAPTDLKAWRLVVAAIAAAILSLAPALALLPKYSERGVHLAAPIFDHSKIAIIDAMTRQGVPPVNPVFASGGEHLVYYYLWHFSAAALALPLRISGWEADIGLTWFTGFASLTLMMALAVWLSRRAGAAIVAGALAASASLRGVLNIFFGNYELEPFLQRPNGFAGWLFQSAWVPQHLMVASGVIASMLLLGHYAQRPKLGYVLTLALVVAASFESSAFVGGVTFVIAALASAPLLFFARELAAQGRSSVTLYGGRSANDLPLHDELARVSQVHLLTEDGSRGTKGRVTALLEPVTADAPSGPAVEYETAFLDLERLSRGVAQERDAEGKVIGEAQGTALGSMLGRDRLYFEVPLQASGASYRVRVLSWDTFATGQ